MNWLSTAFGLINLSQVTHIDTKSHRDKFILVIRFSGSPTLHIEGDEEELDAFYAKLCDHLGAGNLGPLDSMVDYSVIDQNDETLAL